MKGKNAVVLIIVAVLVAVAFVVGSILLFFNQTQDEQRNKPHMDGVVAAIDGQQILVIVGKTKDELEGKEGAALWEGAKEAAWFAVTPDQLNKLSLYSHVTVYYSVMDESFPGQASANSVTVNDE